MSDARRHPRGSHAAADGSAAVLALAYVALALRLSSWSSSPFRRWDVLLASVASLSALVVAAWFAVSRRGAPAGHRAPSSRSSRWCCSSSSWWPATACACCVVGLLLAAALDGAARVRPAAHRRSTRRPRARPAPTPRGADHEPAVRGREGGAVRPGPSSAGDRGIEPDRARPGDDLLALAEDAVPRGADVIGMAGATARRRSSPRSRAATASRSSSSRPAPATTSRSTSGSTATTSSARWTPTTTASTGDRPGRGQRPRLREQRVDGAVREDRAVRRTTATPRCAPRPTCCPTSSAPTPCRSDLRFSCPSGEAASSASCSCRTTPTSSRLRGGGTRARSTTACSASSASSSADAASGARRPRRSLRPARAPAAGRNGQPASSRSVPGARCTSGSTGKRSPWSHHCGS